MKNRIAVHEYLEQLGISADLADIYIALCEHGPLNLMQLSLRANVDRGHLYRQISKLKDAYLIEVQEQYKRKTYSAAPLANLHIILADRQNELDRLDAELRLLQQSAHAPNQELPPTRVQFYQGESGVKQMLWNQTRSSGENLSLLSTNMQLHVNQAFFVRWIQCCNERGLQFRTIAGDGFLESQNRWYERRNTQKLLNWQGRYVPPQTFAIAHSMVVYDNVVANYSWKDGQVFGCELYNAEIADAQRQYFELLWRLGNPIANYGLEKSTA